MATQSMTRLTALAALASFSSLAHAQSITGVGFLSKDPGSESWCTGVSADGSVVVGVSRRPPHGAFLDQAFRWTRGEGIVELFPGKARALDVSADGVTVVGNYGDLLNGAYRWTSDEGLVDLGWLGYDPSVAASVNVDGSVIVGDSEVASGVAFPGTRAFRWTEGSGMVNIGDANPESFALSSAHAVSADGSVIVGRLLNQSSFQFVPYRWTAADGMRVIDLSPLGAASGVAADVSADGSIVIGFTREAGPRAFRWTAGEGAVEIPGLAGARAMTPDGSVIVGGGFGAAALPVQMWRADLGVVDLRDHARDLGVDMTGWLLTALDPVAYRGEPLDISDDGGTIVGIGLHNGEHEGFVLSLGGCRADFNDDGVVNSQDFFDFLSAFFAELPAGDFNADGVVNSQDFFDFVSVFFRGC